MKFVKKQKESLSLGQHKTVNKFAFFPVYTDEGETLVWLENYVEVYEVKIVVKTRPTGVGMFGIWMGYESYKEKEWVSLGKKSL